METRRSLLKTGSLALVAIMLATGTMAKNSLWKVTSETGTLYLQGSIHVLKAEHYPLAPAIEAAYAQSDVLVLEVDMAEFSLPSTQQRIMKKAMFPGTKTLKTELDEATYQKLMAACTQADLPPASLEKFKPWFASVSLTQVQLQKMGFDPQRGLDLYFYTQAKADEKKVIGLESIAFQIDLFDRLSKENPNDFIARMLANLDVLEAEMDAIGQAWETGNIDALGKLMVQSFEDYPTFHKIFLTDRNNRWVKTLDGLLKQPKIHMVVVGAGHLPGKGGLLERLEKKGYTIEQL